MLGLAAALPEGSRSVFLCFMENGKGQAFVDAVRAAGHTAIALRYNFPHVLRSAREVAQHLRELNADVLLTHNYKPNIIGYAAARRCHVPIIAVSRGWTWATLRVRLYEAIDRRMLRRMDRVVCVSEGQAQKVRRAGVPEERIAVIRNAIDLSRFARFPAESGTALKAMFCEPVTHVVMAVGRLSPEKGFDTLIEAAAQVCRQREDVGFVLIGEGPLGPALVLQVKERKLQGRFIFAGFRKDVDALLPHVSCLVQSSYTEGMPNVVLEAMAASIPVVATAVGGTPEAVIHGETGLLAPPHDATALSAGILTLLCDSVRRADMGMAGRTRVEEQFTFEAQAAGYQQLFSQLKTGATEVPRDIEALVASARA